jgi:hypothetical protein
VRRVICWWVQGTPSLKNITEPEPMARCRSGASAPPRRRLQPGASSATAEPTLATAIATEGPLLCLPSRPGEFHPEPLTEPYVNLSIHTARAIA